MQDGDGVAAVRAAKVLIARDKSIEGVSFQVLGEKRRGTHLGVHRLRERGRKLLAEEERTQVFDRGNTTYLLRKERRAVELDVLATLVDLALRLARRAVSAWRSGRTHDAAVENLEVTDIEKCCLAGTRAIL